jgi:hypothetical protein
MESGWTGGGRGDEAGCSWRLAGADDASYARIERRAPRFRANHAQDGRPVPDTVTSKCAADNLMSDAKADEGPSVR